MQSAALTYDDKIITRSSPSLTSSFDAMTINPSSQANNIQKSTLQSHLLNHEKIVLNPTVKRCNQSQLTGAQEQRNSNTPTDSLPVSLILPTSFKMVSMLMKPVEKVQACCYIPERKLLLLLLKDGTTVKIFSTRNFKVVMVKIFPKALNTILYVKELRKVLFAGQDYYLEVFSIRSLKTEKKAISIAGQHINGITYIAKDNIYALMLGKSGIRILSRTLQCLLRINGKETTQRGGEVISLHSGFLLFLITLNYFPYPKKIFAYNFKTRKRIEVAEMRLCESSCIEITQGKIGNTVTCLANTETEASTEKKDFRIVQLGLDMKRERLIVQKRSPKHLIFQEMHRIQNSDYFVARGLSAGRKKDMLLRIVGGTVQVIKVMDKLRFDISLEKRMVMLNESSILLGVDMNGGYYAYKFILRNVKQEMKDNKQIAECEEVSTNKDRD